MYHVKHLEILNAEFYNNWAIYENKASIQNPRDMLPLGIDQRPQVTQGTPLRMGAEDHDSGLRSKRHRTESRESDVVGAVKRKGKGRLRVNLLDESTANVSYGNLIGHSAPGELTCGVRYDMV